MIVRRRWRRKLRILDCLSDGEFGTVRLRDRRRSIVWCREILRRKRFDFIEAALVTVIRQIKFQRIFIQLLWIVTILYGI